MPGELHGGEINKLTPEQQSEVMHLAARLQSEDSEKLSPEQLAKIACEAGIEERFVHEAISRIQSVALQPEAEIVEVADPPYRAVALIFGVIQFWAALVAVNLDFIMSGIKGQPLFVTGFLAFMMGWFSSLDRAGRWRGFAWILGTAVLGLSIAGLFHVGFLGYQCNPKWLTWAALGLLTQFVGFRLGRVLKFINRTPSKPPANPALFPKG